MDLKLVKPGFWMSVLLVVITFGVQMVLAMPLGIIDVVFEQGLQRPAPHLVRQPLILGLINIVALGTAIAFGLFLNRLSFRRGFPLVRMTAGQIVGTAVIVLGLSCLLSEVDNALRFVLPPPGWVLNLIQDVFFDKQGLVSRAILLVVIAPITEELLFRGIILRGLLSRFRPWAAITLTAILFAVLHANPWQFFSALFLGTAFGWIYLRTGSVQLCVLGHAMANSLCLIFALLPWHIPGMTGDNVSAAIEFQPWWLDLSGLGVLLAGLWIFHCATPLMPEPEPPPVPPIIS